MTRKLFGTDGIRGVANAHPMTGELAMQLGRAIAHLFKEEKGRHRIVVGKDTRLSGYMLETAMASGICSMGADVMLVGPLPPRASPSSRRACGPMPVWSSQPLIIPITTMGSRYSPGTGSNFRTRWNTRSKN